MNRYTLSHLDDQVLLRDLASHVAKNCAATADLLAHLAEVDARKLFLPAAHPSMHSYCVHVLRLSKQAAYKRIRVARAAREFPVIFRVIADGRIHLGGMTLLVPYLNQDMLEELLAAAEHKTCGEIESLLARRFPKADLPTRVEALLPAGTTGQLSTWRVEAATTDQLSAKTVDALVAHGKVLPRSPEKFALQFTVSREAHDKLRYAQSLLSHTIPAGGLPEVFERALDALIDKLEKAKFAATSRPRAARGKTSTDPRNIPAHVKRAVWERDGGQCGFVSEGGARCPERSRLEFDHILEVARGGEATVDGIRLRCRAHNQYEAERTFGTGFMERKREESRRAAAERKLAAAQATDVRPISAVRAPAPECCRVPDPPAPSPPEYTTEQQDIDQDLLHCLKGLGVRADRARQAVEHSRGSAEASIEERLHAALRFIGQRGRTHALQLSAMKRAG